MGSNGGPSRRLTDIQYVYQSSAEKRYVGERSDGVGAYVVMRQRYAKKLDLASVWLGENLGVYIYTGDSE
jgi:hypothetical protein